MIVDLRKRIANLAFERGGLIALVTLVVYLWLAPPHIVDGDNAEFATLGSTGGVAHPSGYPLYLIWLRLTSWLPAQSPAHAAALATSILAAIQILILHAACRAWGARASAASLAVAVFAAGPAVLRIQSEAEVFALNGLIVSCVLWLSATNGPLRGSARSATLGLVAGLGLANHLTCVLVAPIGLTGVVRGMRESARPRAVVAAVTMLGLIVGLTPYLYLMVTRETLLSWTRISDLEHLVHHFLREDYGGAGQFAPQGTDVSAGTSTFAMLQTIGRGWLWAPLVIGIATLVRQIARPNGPETRWSWITLALAIVVAGPLLASRFNVAPEGIGLYVVRRFHVLPTLLFAPAVAVGFHELAAFLQRRVTLESLRSRALGGVFATVVFVAVAGLSLPHLLRVHSPAVELGLRNTLRSLPPNAVLITHTDLFHFGIGYLQGALGERNDVTVITWPQMRSRIYRARLARRAGIELDPDATSTTTVEVAELVLAMQRPLFIDAYNSNIAKAFPTYPYGILFRVLPRGVQAPSIVDVFTLNRDIFEKFELGYEPPGLDDEYATDMHQQYARLWHILARGLAAAGHREQQAVAAAFAEALAPRERP